MNIKHGHSKSGGLKTREYRSWSYMKARCFNKNNKNYSSYGGRGITVCPRWKNSFINFLDDMGPSNGLTIERVDVNGNYEPGNCRWATNEEQQINRRNSTIVFHNGERVSISYVNKLYGFKHGTYYRRKKLGWSDDKIFNTPVRHYKPRRIK